MHYEKYIDGTVECIRDEMPFELPEGWGWARLENCCAKEIRRGKSPKYVEQSGTLVFAQKCNTKYDGIDVGLALYLDESILAKYPVEEYMQDGDIVINSTGTGTLGRVGIYRSVDNYLNLPIVPDSHITVVRPHSTIQAFYLYAFMKANQSELEKQGEGSTNQKELKPLTLKEMLVPVPPYTEQKRITSKLDKILSLIAIIENDKNALHNTISAAKSKILDLAVRGKLVPQDPADEPASALLERIRAEKEEMAKQGKIRRGSSESAIFKGGDNRHYEKSADGRVKCVEDELPFELPEGWEWARLQSITSILTDGTHKTPEYSDSGYIFLSSRNVTSGKIDWNNIMHIPEALHNELSNRVSPKINDILLAKNGTTGVAAIVDKDKVFDIYVSLALIRIIDNIIFPNYVLHAIGSPYIQDFFNSSLKGIGVPNLHLEHIRKTLIPVPPYQEQLKIVDMVEQLLDKISAIETSLN